MKDGLHEYGIQTEGSDYRAHVCPVVRRVYVYPTKLAVDSVVSSNHKETKGFQKGVSGPTSKGFLVPPKDIPNCKTVQLPDKLWENANFNKDMEPTEKGKLAVGILKKIILAGFFPLAKIGKEIANKDMQIQGADIILPARKLFKQGYIIQVKCDYIGGPKRLGGSGNLFLQTAERNPKKFC